MAAKKLAPPKLPITAVVVDGPGSNATSTVIFVEKLHVSKGHQYMVNMLKLGKFELTMDADFQSHAGE